MRVTVDDQTTSTTEQDTVWVEFTWNVTNTDREPVFTGGATQSQTIAENGTLDAVLATDADSDPIEYALGTGSDPLPDGIILLSGGGFSGTASYGSEGVYVVLSGVDAAAGGATVQAQVTITVTNVDTKPDITSPGEQNNAETNVVSLDMSTYASDDDGDVPVFSAAGLPDGLSIDSGTGVISGTISYDAAAGSPYTVRVTVDDQTTSTTEQDTAWVEFTWNVTNTDREPVFTGGATQSQTIAENGTLDAVLATDADSDPIEYALGTGSDPLPDGIILLSGGGFSGTASYGSEGVYVVLIDATAGGATVQAQVTITVTNVDTPPELATIVDRMSAEGAVVSFQIEANDPDGDPLTYTATGLPPDLSINESTGLITGTISPEAAAGTPYSVEVIVQDNTPSGNDQASQTFSWEISDVDRAPEFTGGSPQSQEINEGAGLTAVEAVDPDGQTVTYSLAAESDALPNGITLDAASGAFLGTASYTSVGVYNLQIVATAGDLTATLALTVTVNNNDTKPTIVAMGDQTDAEGNTVSADAVGADDDGDDLTYYMTGGPASISIDPSTGHISGTFSYTDAGTYDVTIYVEDDTPTGTGGLPGPQDTAMTTFTLIIENVDTTPELGEIAAQTNAEGDEVSLDVSPYAGDVDGDALTYSATGLPDWLSIDSQTGVISGTVSHDAATGTDYSVIVTVRDDTPTNDPDYAETDEASRIVIWTINNTDRGPEFVGGAVQSQTINEGEGLLKVPAVDPDGDEVSYAIVNGTLPNYMAMQSTGDFTGTASYASAGTYSVDIEATAGGLKTTTTLAITVNNVDTTPELTGPGNQTNAEGAEVSLDVSTFASDVDGDGLTYSATGLPDWLSINGATGVISGTVSNDAEASSPYTVTITVQDDSPSADPEYTEADRASVTIEWTISNTDRAPEFTGGSPQSQTINENEGLAAVEAIDPDGETVTYSLAAESDALPAGITLDAATGSFSGKATYGSAGTYNLQIVATAGSLSETLVLTVTVNNVDTTPQISSPGNQLNAEGDVVSLDVSPLAGDPDGDGLSYSATGLPDWLSIDSGTGVISGTVSNDAEAGSPYSVTITVQDNTPSADPEYTEADRASVGIQWTISNTDRAPEFTGGSPQSQTINENEGLTAVEAIDPDGETVTYALAAESDALPAGITLDAATGSFSGVASYASTGTYNLQIVATAGSLSETLVLTVTVNNVDTTPQISSPGNQLNAEGDVVSLDVSPLAGDPDGDGLSYSATGLPDWLSIDSGTGIISGTVSNDAEAGSPYSVTITVQDNTPTADPEYTEADRASVGIQWTISNTDRKPVFTGGSPQSQEINEGEGLTAVEAIDPDGQTVTYTLAAESDALPAGITLDAATGSFSGKASYNSVGTYNLQIVATAGSLSETLVLNVKVNNFDTKPTITAMGDQTDSEGNTVSADAVGADEDGDALTYTATGAPSGITIDPSTGHISGGFSYADAGTYTVTIMVTDNTPTGTGGLPGPQDTAATTFTLIVQNVDTPPQLAEILGQTSAEGAVVSVTVSGSDPDGDVLSYSASNLPEWLSIDSETGTISGTVSADAAAGSPYTVTVFVSDDTPTNDPDYAAADSASRSFTWTITNVDRAPVFSDIETNTTQSISEGQGLVAVEATDPDGQTVSYALDSESDPLPEGITLEAGGSFSGVASYNSAGTHEVQIVATAGGLSTMQTLSITVTDVPRDLTISLDKAANVTIAEQEAFEVNVTAGDPEGTTISLALAGGPTGSMWVPSPGNPATGSLTWTPGYDAAASSPYKLVFTATAGTRTVKDSVTVTVTDVQRDLVLTLPTQAQRTVAEGASFDFTFGATDPDGGTIQLSAQNVPDGASFNAATGVFTWATGYADAGPYTVSFTASVPDVKDSTVAVALTVTNTNRDPSISHIYTFPISTEEGAPYVLNATVSDPDADDELTVTATSSPEGLPISVELADGTADVTLNPGYDLATTTETAEFQVTIRVNDGTTTIAATPISVTILNKNRTPVMTAIAPQTVTEGKSLALHVQASDADGDDLYLRVVNRPLNAAVVDSELTFTWNTAQSDVGNHTLNFQVWDRRVFLRPARAADVPEYAQQEVQVTVVDTNYAPVIQPIPNVEAQVNQTVTLAVQATDHDGDSLTYADNTDLFDINEKTGVITYTPALADTLPGQYTVTVTVTDKPGAWAQVSFEITVTKDRTAPYIIGQPQAQGITTTQATIIWDTNEPATSVVRYGVVGGARDRTVSDAALVTHHVVTLTGLTQNVTYTYDVRSWDDVQNASALREGTFKTQEATVTLPLSIIGRPAYDASDTYATITWQTNRYSSSIVTYGTAKTLGQQATGASATSHSVSLSGLTAGTRYYYRVRSVDADNLTAESAIDSFRTRLGTQPVVITGGPSPTFRSDSAFTVTWTTDRASISVLQWGTSSSYGRSMVDSSLTTSHSLTATGLIPSTLYHYRVGSNGPEKLFANTYSPDKEVYTEATADMTSPVFTEGPSVPIRNHESVTVSWKTDELANSIVYYAVDEAGTSGYTHTATRSEYTTQHDVTLSNLSPSTRYRYKAESYDIPGNLPTSRTGTFATNQAADVQPPVLVTGSVRVTATTDKSASVGWTTDERSDSWVVYQSTAGTDEVVLSDLVRTHVVPLTGLTPQTRYNLSLYSRDQAGNMMGPVTTSFRTNAEPDTLPPVIVSEPVVEGQRLNQTTNLVDVTMTLATDEESQVTVRYGTSETELTGQVASPARGSRHTIQFTNLPAGTEIFYQLILTDFAEIPNVATGRVRSFRTREGLDRTAPRITGAGAVDVQTTNFTVRWQTDEAATSVINYGTTASELGMAVEDLTLTTTHTLTVTNLTAGTKYFWRVSSADASGNRAPSGVKHTTTEAEPDNTPPVFTVEPIPSYVGDATLVMVWSTDEKTMCEVYVAPRGSDEYIVSHSSGGSERGGTNHAIRIVNLLPGTEYLYFVLARDGAGNIALSGAYDAEEFANVPIDLPEGRVARRSGGRVGGSTTTSPDRDTQYPVITVAPSVAGVSPTGATVTWQTDEASNSVVRILEQGAASRAGRDAAAIGETLLQNGRPVTLSEDVLNHQVSITELTPNTQYVLHVASTDPQNNGETISDVVYLTTAATADLNPPVISGVIVNAVTDVQAVVSWETDELASSTVEFGLSASSLTGSRSAEGYTKRHDVALTNLTAGTPYYYRVISTDAANNPPAASAVKSFTTVPAADVTPPQIVGPVQVVNVTNQTATIRWATNEPADTYVEYGVTKSYGRTFVSTTPVLNHSVTFTNLLPATTYYFSITSADIAHNTSTPTAADSLTTVTEADVTPPAAPATVDTLEGSNRVVLLWSASASTDAAAYVVYRNSQLLASGVAETAYTDQTVTNGTTYTYEISCVDFTGNEGSKSPAVRATPLASEAPTAPGLLAPLGGQTGKATDDVTCQVSNSSRATSRPDQALTYSFVISTDSLLVNIIASGAGVAEGTDGTTEWSLPASSFEDDTRYFWAAQASDDVSVGPLSIIGTFDWGVTSVELESFTAVAHPSGAVRIQWALRVSGNDLNRIELLRGTEQADAGLVGAYGPEGINGNLFDRLPTGITEAAYWLKVVYDGGTTRVFGPVTADVALPQEWTISNAVPNPFNPITAITLSVPEQGEANVVIYNVLGQPIRTLLTGHITAGIHRLVWNGRDDLGRDAASGVYLVRLTTSSGVQQIRRMTLVR